MYLCCQAVNAEETRLDTVEVYSQSETPFGAQSISLSDYDYAFGGLNSVLGRIPGFQIQSSGGFGAYSDFTLRGSSARSVPVYFDGVKVNDPLTGGLNLSTFPLWSLQSLNVYKALIPAELANNAGTSVINLNSQAIESKQDLKVSAGSFGSQSLAGNLANTQYLMSAEYLKSDNDFSYQHNNQTPQNIEDDYSTDRKNNQVERSFVLLKSTTDYSSFKLKLMAIHRQYDAGVSNNLNQAKTAEINQESTLMSAVIENGNWDIYINTDFANQDYNDVEGEIGLAEDSQEISYKKSELKLVNKSKFKDVDSTLAIQGQKEETDKIDTLNNTTSNSFISANFISLAHNLTFNKDFIFSHSWLSRESNNSSYESYNSGLGYYFDLGRGLNSDISISKKTRLPTVAELYLNQGNITANPDLKPEDFYELNIRSKFNFSKIGGQIELYFRDSKDTIIYSYDARGVGQASNEGSSKTTGLESLVYWDIGLFQFNWNIELIDTENTSNNKASNRQKLPAFFHASQYISLGYSFDELKMGIANQRRYNMYYDSANLVKAPNQNTWSISANYNQYPWQLGAHINNIFDKFYTGFKTEPLPGRSFTITLSFSN